MISPLEYLRARSPRGQIALVLAGVAILGTILAALYLVLLRPQYDVLFTDLRTADAATIVAQLEEKKTPYRLADSGTTILVPEAVVDATRLDVMSTELPLKGMVGFELFNKSDMGLTEFAQKINYQRALQGELARTIMTMDTVDSARVHLTIPEATIFRADRRPPKASVTIIPRSGQVVGPQTVQGIQRLVAASVADLDVANVVILDEHGALVSGVVEAETVSPGLQQSRAVEQFYEAEVRARLAPLYPNAQPTVIIPAAQWAQGGLAGVDGRQAAIDAWRAEARTFRLEVRIASPTSLTPGDQQDIRALIGQAIGATDSGEDTVTFMRAEPTMADPGPSLSTSSADAVPVASAIPPPFRLPWPTLIGLGVLGILAFLLYLYRPRRSRLSANELDDYAARLKRLLEEEETHAAHPL